MAKYIYHCGDNQSLQHYILNSTLNIIHTLYIIYIYIILTTIRIRLPCHKQQTSKLISFSLKLNAQSFYVIIVKIMISEKSQDFITGSGIIKQNHCSNSISLLFTVEQSVPYKQKCMTSEHLISFHNIS